MGVERKYLVTGGSGFIGSALVHRLVQEGYRVRIFDNQARGSLERLKDLGDDIEIVAADIRDKKAVAEACRGVDSVIHLAYINGTEFFYSQPELVLDVGVKGIVNVMDACLETGIKELILASSSEVYQTPSVVPTDETTGFSIPDPMNPRYSYAAGKIISEMMAINYGRKSFERVVIFRPHNVYGPNMGWEHVIPQFALRMRALVRDSSGKRISFPIQGTGEETRAFVYIDDFIDGVMLLLGKGKHLGIYHIGTQEEISIKKLAIEAGKYFSKEVHVVASAPAKGGTARRCPNISKMQLLGYQPKFKLRDGLPKALRWYDEHAGQAPERLLVR